MARTLSTQQIAAGLRKAGFPEQVIPTMTAVTMAESGGNPYAHNPNRDTGDNSYGLLQINMIDGMGPERRKDFGISSDDQLFDTDTNFRAAKRIYDQQGIGAWGAYTNGSYKKYLGKDSAGGASVKAGDAGPNAAFVSGGGSGLPPMDGLSSSPDPEIPKGTLSQRVATAGLTGGLGQYVAGFSGGGGGAKAGAMQVPQKPLGSMDLMAGIDDDNRMAGAALGNDIFATAVSKATGTGQSGRMAAVAPGGNHQQSTSHFITGNTGASTGPHLDFRVWDKAKGGYVSNPGDYAHLVTTQDGTSVAKAFQMTSPHGMRTHPVHGGQRMHHGIDYATPEGTKLNVAGRFVERKFDKGGGGNMSIYDIGDGKEAVLLHGA